MRIPGRHAGGAASGGGGVGTLAKARTGAGLCPGEGGPADPESRGEGWRAGRTCREACGLCWPR